MKDNYIEIMKDNEKERECERAIEKQGVDKEIENGNKKRKEKGKDR